MPHWHVYVIGEAEDGPVKVGMARDPVKRLGELQVGNPNLLRLFHALKVPGPAAAPLEAAAHQALAEHHRRGEWFTVSAGKAWETVERLSPPFIEAALASLAQSPRWLDRLDGKRELSPWVWPAMEAYLMARQKVDGANQVSEFHSAIRANAGDAALTVFKLVASGTSLELALGREPKAMENALTSLASAVNGLARHFAGKRIDELERNILCEQA